MKHSIQFWNISYSSGTFHTVLEHSIQFWNIPYSSGTFHTVLEHSIQFWNIPYSSGTFHTVRIVDQGKRLFMVRVISVLWIII